MKKRIVAAICIASLCMSLFAVPADACVHRAKKNGLIKPHVTQSVVTTKSIRLKWNSIRNAKGYLVKYRLATAQGKYAKKIINGQKKTTVLLKKLKSNKRYEIRVVAFKYKNGQKLYGAPAKLNGYTYLSAPAGDIVQTTTSQISLDWGKSDSGAKVQVARADMKDGPYHIISDKKSDLLNDKNVTAGGVYYYKARLIKKYSKKTRYSKWSAPCKTEARNCRPQLSMESITPNGTTDTVVIRLDADQYNYPLTIQKLYASGVKDMLDIRDTYYSFDGENYVQTYSSDLESIILEPSSSIYLKYVFNEPKDFTNKGKVGLWYTDTYTKKIRGTGTINICLTNSLAWADVQVVKCVTLK